MILTIGMIVKNEEKWLDKCLSAIKPILDNVDCELIITDTGSTDKTIEIAKKYTDKVLHFDWVNDFSAARNFGLEKAHGEWFMYLDADDIFESCDGIINFFNSGDYKIFNSASYIGKNVVDNSGYYVINKQPRITKILRNTTFKNSVHEVLNTYGFPKVDLKDIAVHYGYLFENEEQRRAKKERNKNLLLKRMETERKTNAYLYVQLCENETDFDNEAALNYIDEGIQLSKKLNDISIIPLMMYKANIYFNKKEYEISARVCEEYFKLGKPFRNGSISTDGEILAIWAMDCYALKIYKEAYNKYLDFFDIYHKLSSGRLNTPDSDIVVRNLSTPEKYINHSSRFISCCIETNHYKTAYKMILDETTKKCLKNDTCAEDFINNAVNIFESVDFNGFSDYWNDIDEYSRLLYIKRLCQIVHYSDKKEDIINLLKTIPEYEEKSKIYESYFSNSQILYYVLWDYVQKYGVNENPDIFMIAAKKQYDISEMLFSDKCNINKLTYDGYKYYYGFNKAIDNYDIRFISNTEGLVAAAKFYESCMHCTVGFKSPKPKTFVVINANKLLENFGNIGLRLERESVDLSNDLLKSAVIVGHAVELRRAKQYKNCISELKSAIVAYNPLADFINAYCDDVIAEYRAEENRHADLGDEMQKLAAVIKSNIRNNIASGDITKARHTLSEYMGIAPADPDIIILQEEIDNKL